MQVIADKPLAAFNGDRFILRDQSAMRTIGGGTIIDPFVAPARVATRKRAPAQLAALENADPDAALAALARMLRRGRRSRAIRARVQPRRPTAHAKLAQTPDIAIVGKEHRVALPRATVDGDQAKTSSIALTRFHRDRRRRPASKSLALRKQLAPGSSAATFTALLRELGDDKKIEIGQLDRAPAASTWPPTIRPTRKCGRH